jgi:hypothetical protein
MAGTLARGADLELRAVFPDGEDVVIASRRTHPG